MPRTMLRGLGGMSFLVLALTASALALPPSEQILPGTTKGFVSVVNVKQCKDVWKKTQLGQLIDDPVMEPFAKDLRRQVEDRYAGAHDKFGVTLDDLFNVPTGELAVARILLSDKESAAVFFMDVTGQKDQAKAMLERAYALQTKRGAKRSQEEVSGTTIVRFDQPKPANEADGEPGQALYFLADNAVAISDHPAAIKAVLAKIKGGKGDTLAAQKSFAAVMARCAKDTPKDTAKETPKVTSKDAPKTAPKDTPKDAPKDTAKNAPKSASKEASKETAKDTAPDTPVARWYIQPLGYAEAERIATPEAHRRKGKSVVQLMKNQGFGGIQGVGGTVSLKVDRYEMIHRTAIHAPPPREKSMKILAFPNDSEFTPQSWVPRDVATYCTLYCDPLIMFDNFGSMFDELFGEGGETGVWNDVLLSLKDDPNGPRIDLRKELVEKLGKRVTVITDYQLPITTNSERLLIAISTKDEKAVAAGIAKWMKNDPTAKKREFEGRIIWEMVEPEEPQMPEISVEAIPSVTPSIEPPKIGKGPAGPAAEDEGPKLLPHAAVTVANGELLIASHLDFLLKILPGVEARKSLARDAEYRRVATAAGQLGSKDKFTMTFSRTDEEYRATYELIKQGKMPQSETMMARALNGIFGSGKKGVVRKQQVDGSRMPDYEVVRRYLGSAGMTAVTEPDGWFFKGFTITKGAGQPSSGATANVSAPR